MTEKKLYLIVQSVVCVLLVILLAASAVSIYREGKARKAEDPMESIYTAEKAAEKFRPIAPLFFGSFGLTAAGWILAVKDDSAEKPVRDTELARNLIVARVVDPGEQMKEEQRRQKKLRRVGRVLFLLSLVPVIIYVANGEHFPGGSLEEMAAALAAHIFPWIILGFGCLIVSTVLQEKSMLRETAAAQAQIKAEKESGSQSGIRPEPKADGIEKDSETEKKSETEKNSTKNCPQAGNPKVKRTLRIVLTLAAVVFIVLGVMNGSAKAVFTKAANICTECIGLG